MGEGLLADLANPFHRCIFHTAHADTTSRDNDGYDGYPSVQDIPRLHLKNIDFSVPKRQPIVPSFTCIPGSSRKIEAPSPSEIKKFSSMIAEENRTSISS